MEDTPCSSGWQSAAFATNGQAGCGYLNRKMPDILSSRTFRVLDVSPSVLFSALIKALPRKLALNL
jgi:hypothetical protein